MSFVDHFLNSDERDQQIGNFDIFFCSFIFSVCIFTDYMSFVDDKNGSWLILTICDVISQYKHFYHVSELLTIARELVSTKRKQFHQEVVSADGGTSLRRELAVQMPCSSTTFRKQFWLVTQTSRRTHHVSSQADRDASHRPHSVNSPGDKLVSRAPPCQQLHHSNTCPGSVCQSRDAKTGKSHRKSDPETGLHDRKSDPEAHSLTRRLSYDAQGGYPELMACGTGQNLPQLRRKMSHPSVKSEDHFIAYITEPGCYLFKFGEVIKVQTVRRQSFPEWQDCPACHMKSQSLVSVPSKAQSLVSVPSMHHIKEETEALVEETQESTEIPKFYTQISE